MKNKEHCKEGVWRVSSGVLEKRPKFLHKSERGTKINIYELTNTKHSLFMHYPMLSFYPLCLTNRYFTVHQQNLAFLPSLLMAYVL